MLCKYFSCHKAVATKQLNSKQLPDVKQTLPREYYWKQINVKGISIRHTQQVTVLLGSDLSRWTLEVE